MPKRYRPSEKMPIDARLIVVKVIGNPIRIGRYFIEVSRDWPWYIFYKGFDYTEVDFDRYDTHSIDWWLDPMEEE